MKIAEKISSNAKKYLLIGGLVVVVGIVAVANYRLSNPLEQAGDQVVQGDDSDMINIGDSENFFEVFKVERNAVREKEIEYIDTIIADTNTDKETLADAQQQKLALVEAMEKESLIEQLLLAKGFSNVAVTYQKGSANVIVDDKTISDAQAAQILDIVKKETGETTENIKIMPRQ